MGTPSSWSNSTRIRSSTRADYTSRPWATTMSEWSRTSSSWSSWRKGWESSRDSESLYSGPNPIMEWTWVKSMRAWTSHLYLWDISPPVKHRLKPKMISWRNRIYKSWGYTMRQTSSKKWGIDITKWWITKLPSRYSRGSERGWPGSGTRRWEITPYSILRRFKHSWEWSGRGELTSGSWISSITGRHWRSRNIQKATWPERFGRRNFIELSLIGWWTISESWKSPSIRMLRLKSDLPGGFTWELRKERRRRRRQLLKPKRKKEASGEMWSLLHEILHISLLPKLQLPNKMLNRRQWRKLNL